VPKLRAPIFLALTIVISVAITDAALAPAPAPMQPDFIDTVLASRAVVVAIRIAIVFATLFVALSVIALIVRRQWLTRIGPVEASDRTAELEEELEAAHQVIDALESMAVNSQQVIDRERR